MSPSFLINSKNAAAGIADFLTTIFLSSAVAFTHLFSMGMHNTYAHHHAMNLPRHVKGFETYSIQSVKEYSTRTATI